VAGEFDDGVLRVRRVLGEAGVGYGALRLQLEWGFDGVVCCASSGQGGRGWFAHWPRWSVAMAVRVSVSPLFFAGEDEQRLGRGKVWRGRAPGCLRTRVEEPGRARGEASVVGVLKQLGGIPPSSLGARGGRRQGREVGWAGWAVALGVR
jgi:hypothetical protein